MTMGSPKTLLICLLLLLGWTTQGIAQTFSSGSTGADGAFAPTATIAVPLPPNGILNYTTVDIPVGVTVTFVKNAANTPVIILATGDITIAGFLNLRGANGVQGSETNAILVRGSEGGPGGFAGGNGGVRGLTTREAGNGQGPGGGAGSLNSQTFGQGGTYGVPSSAVSMIPLVGGSGGGGGFADFFGATFTSGSSGGGGGGALVLASSTRITINGPLRADGGHRGEPRINISAGAGSGGAIRLVAPVITGTGNISANGGSLGAVRGAGGPGRLRFEATTLSLSGTISPTPTTSTTLGPITATSTPAIQLPTVSIQSVNAFAPPNSASVGLASPDISLPLGTTNPVSMLVRATNTPVGAVFTIKVHPEFAPPTTFTTPPTTGTFSLSTSTAPVNLPIGQISLINIYGSFTLPQIATLFPLIDGEPVDHIMVATAPGQQSTVMLVTKSGKEIPADQLLPQDRLILSQSWQALSSTPKK